MLGKFKELIKHAMLDVIMEQQANTKINESKDGLLYLMAFNDGAIELANILLDELDKVAEEEESDKKESEA